MIIIKYLQIGIYEKWRGWKIVVILTCFFPITPPSFYLYCLFLMTSDCPPMKKIKITQIMGVTAYYDPFWSYLLMLTINLYSKYSFLCKPNFHYTLDLVLYVAHSLSRADGILVKMKSYPCPQWTVWLDLLNELLVYMNWKLNQTHHSLCLTEQAHVSTSTSSDTIALFLCTCSFLVL